MTKVDRNRSPQAFELSHLARECLGLARRMRKLRQRKTLDHGALAMLLKEGQALQQMALRLERSAGSV